MRARELTYSSGFLLPFIMELNGRTGARVDPLLLADTIGTRMSMTTAHHALERLVAATGDVDLGLRASRRLPTGDARTFDYLLRTAETVHGAIHVAGTYAALLCDALDVLVRPTASTANVVIHCGRPLPRAAVDFLVAGLYAHHLARWLPALDVTRVHVNLAYPAPPDLSLYRKVFQSPVRFSAPFSGFVFDRQWLRLPICTAEPELHRVLARHARKLLTERGYDFPMSLRSPRARVVH